MKYFLFLLTPILGLILLGFSKYFSNIHIFIHRFIRAYTLVLVMTLAFSFIMFQQIFSDFKSLVFQSIHGIIMSIGLMLSGFIFLLCIVWIFYDKFIFKEVRFALILCSYIMAAYGFSFFLASLGFSPAARSLCLFILVTLLVGNVLIFASLVDKVQNNKRSEVIKTLLISNPIMGVVSTIPGYDPLRSEWLYGNCPIGPYYQFSYPDWESVSILYSSVSVVFFILGGSYWAIRGLLFSKLLPRSRKGKT